jgi:hypothetical protein
MLFGFDLGSLGTSSFFATWTGLVRLPRGGCGERVWLDLDILALGPGPKAQARNLGCQHIDWLSCDCVQGGLDFVAGDVAVVISKKVAYFCFAFGTAALLFYHENTD